MSSPEGSLPFPDSQGSRRWADSVRRLPAAAQAGEADAGAAPGVAGSAPAKYLNRMSMRAGDRIVLISVRDVVWVQSCGNLLRLHLDHASYEHRMTLKAIRLQLDPEQFVRVHRNAIVNLDHVVEFELPHRGNSVVRLRNGKELPISGAARVALRRGLLNRAYSDIDVQ